VCVPQKDESKYTGLPTVYLDQNILDAFLKGKLCKLEESITNRYQAVYSNETLNEIKRAGEASSEYSNSFLKILKKINAAHITIELDSTFYDTDQARISHLDPFDAYKQYCESEPVFNNVAEGMRQFGFKMAGGRKGESLEEVSKDSIDAFSQLMDYMDEQLKVIEDEAPELVNMLKMMKGDWLKEFKKSSDLKNNILSENIEDEKIWSGINDFRRAVKIEPYHFNNIRSPNLLQQIWDKISSSDALSGFNLSLDEFFMFNHNLLMPDKPFFRHLKIIGAYNILNTIGYYPDKPLHKERGFKRATSDQTHASIASFTDCLITADDRFAKKTTAIYEYLRVKTEVMHFKRIE